MPSYNSKLKDEITFYSDHIEYLIDGEWTLLPSDLVSGTAELRCTRLAKDGSSITCDVYEHEVWTSLTDVCQGSHPHLVLLWKSFLPLSGSS